MREKESLRGGEGARGERSFRTSGGRVVKEEKIREGR